MSKQQLTIDGLDITAQLYGVYVDSAQSYNAPKKNVEFISIPGRNGDLVIDHDTFQNVAITYPCLIRGATAKDRYKALISWLANSSRGYRQIWCSDDPNHFREGVFMSQQAPKVKRQGNDIYFDLVFNCKPQRFVYPEVWETNFQAKYMHETCRPIIKVEYDGNNGGTVRVNHYDSTGSTVKSYEDITIAYAAGSPNLYIDCEAMECYGLVQLGPDTIRVPLNSVVSISPNEYPVLREGEMVGFQFSNTFASQAINYREWEL